eukprot:CAMPEP_0172491386 /NCGR_PEP_ID=MMETSP1066-20121228/22171_1 /TAXON_ID=671091 /ORGANISM="Coscinodiscus wailesii, Strain CCMP2513" /LENGTH=72 /DNA_ID=CAMNT_0013260407 /DNA_START=41 /DNA_END=255 /DNA_ORIENTATION=+
MPPFPMMIKAITAATIIGASVAFTVPTRSFLGRRCLYRADSDDAGSMKNGRFRHYDGFTGVGDASALASRTT